MNQVIFSEDVVGVVKSFCASNKGDEATTALILSMGAELLGASVDTLLEKMEGEDDG